MAIRGEDISFFTTASNGPWLFIDLPTGRYDLEAGFKADRKRLPQIHIERGFQKVYSIQW